MVSHEAVLEGTEILSAEPIFDLVDGKVFGVDDFLLRTIFGTTNREFVVPKKKEESRNAGGCRSGAAGKMIGATDAAWWPVREAIPVPRYRP